MLTSNRLRCQLIIPGLGFLIFLFFQLFYPYHLFFKEQIQLFIYTPEYFLSYFTKPAWLARYIGDFLTQFFYLRGGGAITVSFILLIEWIFITKVIDKLTSSKLAKLWALIPVVIDLALQCNILHEISYTISIICTLGIYLLFLKIKSKWFQLGTALIISPLIYWLAGGTVLALPLLIVLDKNENRERKILISILIFVLALIIPLILRHRFLLTIEQAYIFPALQRSSLLIIVALGLVSIFSSILNSFEQKHKTIALISLLLILFITTVIGVYRFADFNQEKELALDSETYFGNTDKVISLACSNNIESRNSSYFLNIALAKKGILADSLLNYYQPASYGLMLPVAPGEGWITIIFSNELYYLIGDMNLAQHATMLGNTFSIHNRSSRMIKRLAEINLVNEDTAAANKYLRILDKTLFHQKWAKAHKNNAPFSSWMQEINEKRSFIPRSDIIRSANDFNRTLSFLLSQNPQNKVALEYLLCYHLLNKDIVSFIKYYNLYFKNTTEHIPKIYQEALLIYFSKYPTSIQEISSYGLDPQIFKSFMEYTKHYDQSNGNIKELQRFYSKTYWYYYHFATMEAK